MIEMIEIENKEAAEQKAEKESPASWGSVHINEQKKRRQSDTPPASKTVKRLWKKHQKDNARSKLSLKSFARSLSNDSKKDVVEWFANKHGLLDRMSKKKKNEVRGSTIRATALASKSSRRGSKSSS
jgi:hypothetical protein